MFDLNLKNADRKWLRENYSELTPVIDKNGKEKITGKLKFDMVYYEENKPYVLNPTQTQLENGLHIRDVYDLEIILQPGSYSELPRVYETSGRIQQNARQRNLPISDIHVNGDGSACLCLSVDEKRLLPDGFKLEHYIPRLVIPFFFAQSHFEKQGSWPWGQWGHGVSGLLEWYFKQPQITKEKLDIFIQQALALSDGPELKRHLMKKSGIKGHHPCICGSTNKFRNCHIDAMRGLRKLKEDMHDLGVRLNP